MYTDVEYMMIQNCFSKEAICFVKSRYTRYLPLLATLANYSAKTIDESYYELKSVLLEDIEVEQDNMGWRTFCSEDHNTSGFPYIYYIETGYTAQISFHSAQEHRANSKGKWSRVIVQDIAPKLVANLLKKDGFEGKVWDMKLIIHKYMQANGLIEAGHLWKGQEYIFVADSNKITVTTAEGRVNPTENLLQSFLTRLVKKEKAQPDSEPSDGQESKQDATDKAEGRGADSTRVTNPGDDDGCAIGGKEIRDCEYRSPEVQEGGSNSGSQQAEYKLSSGHETMETGEDLSQDGLAEVTQETECASDASGQMRSLNDPEQQSDTKAGHIRNAHETKHFKKGSANGFYNLLPFSSNAKSKGGSGGGSQLETKTTKGKPNKLVQDALFRLASGQSLSLKEHGSQNWDVKKFILASKINPSQIDNAKFSRPAEKLIFCVDTSGSVAEFGQFILEMLESAKSTGNFSVWSGSEAWPDKCHTSKKETRNGYFKDKLMEMLSYENPESGSSIVFWGDAHMHFYRDEAEVLRKLSTRYNFFWLSPPNSNEGKLKLLAVSPY